MTDTTSETFVLISPKQSTFSNMISHIEGFQAQEIADFFGISYMVLAFTYNEKSIIKQLTAIAEAQFKCMKEGFFINAYIIDKKKYGIDNKKFHGDIFSIDDPIITVDKNIITYLEIKKIIADQVIVDGHLSRFQPFITKYSKEIYLQIRDNINLKIKELGNTNDDKKDSYRRMLDCLNKAIKSQNELNN